MTALVEREAIVAAVAAMLPNGPWWQPDGTYAGDTGRGGTFTGDDFEDAVRAWAGQVADAIIALRQPGAEYRRGAPSGETLEQYGERIAAKVRRVMMDRLDDDVIGCLGQSHIVFGKACAMEAVTTAMNEVRALSDSIPDTKGGRDGR